MKLIASFFSILFILSLTSVAYSQDPEEKKRRLRASPAGDVILQQSSQLPKAEPVRQVAASKPTKVLIDSAVPASFVSPSMVIVDPYGVHYVPAKPGQVAVMLIDGKPYFPAPGSVWKGMIFIVKTKPPGVMPGKGFIHINNRLYQPTSDTNAQGVFIIFGKAYEPVPGPWEF